jgi:glutathione S-transferase
MKLFYSQASPFARKVVVTAHEIGLVDRIEKIPTDPWASAPSFTRINPLSQVPALIADDGEMLYDSIVICEYLDSLHSGTKLFPPSGKERWRALRQNALADGILVAGVAARRELAARPENLRWPDFVRRHKDAVRRSIEALEAEADHFEPPITIGHIAIACALGYLDFRFAEDKWRTGHPKLTKWFDAFAQRSSMQASKPPSS